MTSILVNNFAGTLHLLLETAGSSLLCDALPLVIWPAVYRLLRPQGCAAECGCRVVRRPPLDLLNAAVGIAVWRRPLGLCPPSSDNPARSASWHRSATRKNATRSCSRSKSSAARRSPRLSRASSSVPASAKELSYGRTSANHP